MARKRITNAQIDLIFAMQAERNMTDNELHVLIREVTFQKFVSALSMGEATNVISALKKERRR